MIAIQDVVDQGDILVAVITLRLAERHLVGRILREAETVVVGLDRAVRFVGGAGSDGPAPVLVDLAGDGFVELIHAFPSDAEGDAGRGAQVAFISRVDEDLALVAFLAAGIPVGDPDFVDAAVRQGELGRVAVKLPHRPYGDAPAFGEHLLEDPLCDAGFEVIAGRAVLDLLGIRPVSLYIMVLDPVYELQEKTCRRSAGRDIRGAESVGRQAADGIASFQQQDGVSHAGSGDG